MLSLLFQVLEDWYALDVTHVVEVLPLVKFKPILHASRGLVGVFNYHGSAVPLIDLSELIVGKATEARMSTRVILVSCPAESGAKVQIGLIVEELLETLRCSESDFIDSGTPMTSSSYLGAITMDRGRIIHQVELKGLLSDDLHDHLRPQTKASA